MIITIDGPTASGKSTVAKVLAERLGMYHLNSGLLFRAFAYVVNQYYMEHADYSLDDVIAWGVNYVSHHITYAFDSKSGARIVCDGADITPVLKSPMIDKMASELSLRSEVRKLIEELQRSIAAHYDVVVDGRDAGSQVFPYADYKFFLTADVAVRAQRWQKDQDRRGYHLTHEQAVAAIVERDRRDSERAIAPLVIAPGAQVIDNTHMSLEETVQEFVRCVQR